MPPATYSDMERQVTLEPGLINPETVDATGPQRAVRSHTRMRNVTRKRKSRLGHGTIRSNASQRPSRAQNFLRDDRR